MITHVTLIMILSFGVTLSVTLGTGFYNTLMVFKKRYKSMG
jgi:hypothetical protein